MSRSKDAATYPPREAKNISPKTSLASVSSSFGISSFAARLAAPQKEATIVPTMHPEPVMLPSIGCPLLTRIAALPSLMTSVFPVMMTIQPVMIVQLKLEYMSRYHIRSFLARALAIEMGSLNPSPIESTPLVDT